MSKGANAGEYFYPVSDSTNNRVDNDSLHEQIESLGLRIPLRGVRVLGRGDLPASVIWCLFDSDLDSSDEATLDGAISSHDGVKKLPRSRVVIDGVSYEATSFNAGVITWSAI